MRVPLSDMILSAQERAYALEALDASWLSGTGPFIARAEEAWARFLGVPFCALVNNGTAALHAALAPFEVGPGDEVIVPGMTFVSPAAAVARCGAIPVFADIEPESWCIDPDEIERLIRDKTKGVVAVDVLGHPADYDRIRAVCNRYGLFLIEDAAEAHGSRYKGRITGTLGDLATFSFFVNKTVGCGEGGAVVGVDASLMEHVRAFRNHGRTSKQNPYWHGIVGDNLRLSNILAAVLLGQIERVTTLIEKRKYIAERYDIALQEIPFLSPRPVCEWAEVVPWLYTAVVSPESPMSVEEIVQLLRSRGIDARRLWVPLVDLPPYEAECRRRHIDTPRAKSVLPRLFWLPTSAYMTEKQIEFVVGCLGRVGQCTA